MMLYASLTRIHPVHALPVNVRSQCGTGVRLHHALHVGGQDSHKAKCEPKEREEPQVVKE